jgi:hypothetical protein
VRRALLLTWLLHVLDLKSRSDFLGRRVNLMPLRHVEPFFPGRNTLKAFSREGDGAMEFLVRIIVGVGAAWIVPDPAPQQSHPSGYEVRCADDRCGPFR